tara:strand:- start:1015 stop:1407 length:393 start_codon:yes stop_codon:yes gene_type:complete
MANQTPLKTIVDNDGNITSLGEFTASDTVSVSNGGTGSTSFLANRILIGNNTSSVTTVERKDIKTNDSTGVITVTGGVDAAVGSDVYVNFDSNSLLISNLAGNLSIARLRDDTSAEWSTEVISQLDGGTF